MKLEEIKDRTGEKCIIENIHEFSGAVRLYIIKTH